MTNTFYCTGHSGRLRQPFVEVPERSRICTAKKKFEQTEYWTASLSSVINPLHDHQTEHTRAAGKGHRKHLATSLCRNIRARALFSGHNYTTGRATWH